MEELRAIWAKVPETLPFSNVWIALQTAHRLPAGSVLHLGILNTLRTWNFLCKEKLKFMHIPIQVGLV